MCMVGCDGTLQECDELPALAIAPRQDGVGAFALHIIGGLAYAAQLGVRFGGAFALDDDDNARDANSIDEESPHGVNRSFVFDALFGNANSVYAVGISKHIGLHRLKLKDYPALVAKVLRPGNR